MIQDCSDVQHEIMLKLLFYTAMRVSELVRIKVIDLGQSKIFIDQGKGAKDRYFLFPASFRLVLKSHLGPTRTTATYLNPGATVSSRPRRIQQIVQKYRERAAIKPKVHPHLFRHQMLTFLTAQGLSDAQIQLISGPESKKSLEVYQHLSLESVEQVYQNAVRSIGI